MRNEINFIQYIEYTHFNPVLHGLVKSSIELPYFSFHRSAKQDTYDSDWGAGTEITFKED